MDVWLPESDFYPRGGASARRGVEQRTVSYASSLRVRSLLGGHTQPCHSTRLGAMHSGHMREPEPIGPMKRQVKSRALQRGGRAA